MSQESLEKLRIKNVIGPTSNGTAVLLGNDEKTFVMFVGLYEGAAILRELNGEQTPRPLTHELINMVLDGFDIAVKQIIISDIIDNTFCATLVLEQKVVDEGEGWVGKRNEVRIDARPSDCIILALKTKQDLYATRRVLEQVRDVTEELGDLKGGKNPFQTNAMAWDPLGLKLDPDSLPDFELSMPKEPEELDEDILEQGLAEGLGLDESGESPPAEDEPGKPKKRRKKKPPEDLDELLGGDEAPEDPKK